MTNSKFDRAEAWSALAMHAARLKDKAIADLFKEDPDRAEKYSVEAAGLFPPSDDMNWASLVDSIPLPSEQTVPTGGYVGLRGALDDPPWFQFLNRRRTQFEFKDRDALDADLLRPMARMTFDAC